MNPTTQGKASDLFRKYYKPLEPILQKPKNRVYTATVLSFLTVSLFVWYAIRPTVQTILSLRREIRDSTQVNEQMETKIAALVEAQASYQEIIPRLGLLKEAVPETPDMVELLVQLRDLARAVDATVSGASVVSIPLTVDKNKVIAPVPEPVPSTSPSSQPAAQKHTTNGLTITVEGPYESVKQFIQGIYSLRRIATITDMSLIPHTSELGTVRGQSLTMTLKLNAYSANE